jgi:hypothetical protein
MDLILPRKALAAHVACAFVYYRSTARAATTPINAAKHGFGADTQRLFAAEAALQALPVERPTSAT